MVCSHEAQGADHGHENTFLIACRSPHMRVTAGPNAGWRWRWWWWCALACGGGAAAGSAGGGAAAGSAGGGAASSGNVGNAGGQAGPPSTTSGNAGSQVGPPSTRSGNAGSQVGAPRSGDASGQVGDKERFDHSVPPAAFEPSRPLRMLPRQLRREFSRAATKPYRLRTRNQAPASVRLRTRERAPASVRLRTGDLSAPWALVQVRPNSPIDAAVG